MPSWCAGFFLHVRVYACRDTPRVVRVYASHTPRMYPDGVAKSLVVAVLPDLKYKIQVMRM